MKIGSYVIGAKYILEILGSILIKATARCEAARANGLGYVSQKAGFEDTHIQSGTDLVGRCTPNFYS